MTAIPADHWARKGVLVLDTETTGVDVETARIASISAGVMDLAAPLRAEITTDYIAVAMPEEAGAVNGLTTEFLEERATAPASVVLNDFCELIAGSMLLGMPVVIANAPYDLTVLDRECRRNGVTSLGERLSVDPWAEPIVPVVDPIVLDKRVVKYRKRVSQTQGARQLKTLAQVHGCGWDDDQAHTSAYDALQAGRVVAALLGKFAQLRALSLPDLHGAQVRWYAEQASGLRDWFARQAAEAEFEADLVHDRDSAEAIAGRARAKEFREKAGSVRLDWPIVPFGGVVADVP